MVDGVKGRRPPIARQRWEAISFLHWPMDPRRVQAALPNGLTVETFDGAAWVGLVPFRTIVTPPAVPLPRWVYLEINVRTYVRAPDGSAGIFFFSFDVPYVWMVGAARVLLGARYMWARTSVTETPDGVRYRAERRGRPAALDALVRPGESIDPAKESALERFLTDRFGLYSTSPIGLLRVNVHHAPWRLRRATAARVREDLVAAGGLPAPTEEPVVHAAEPMPDVRIELPRLVRG